MLDANDLELLTDKLLGEGVPYGVVARALGLNVELVRESQKQVRVKKYGTDDLSEYVEQMQWDAIEQARDILANGSPMDRTRFISTILGKQITLAGRRVPEGTRRAQEDLLTMLEGQRTGKATEHKEKSKFVVSITDDVA